MGQHRRIIGWCLLAVSSLAWFGCQQLWSHRANQDDVIYHQVKAPEHAPPLQIPDPPPPPAASSNKIASNPGKQLPPGILTSRATLLPPVNMHLEPLPADPGNKAISPPIAVNAAAEPLRSLYRTALERFTKTPTFTARLHRQERFDGKLRPEEMIVFQYRRDPASIHMRWIGETAKGREVLYISGKFNDPSTETLHFLPGAGDPVGLKAVGKQVLLRHDSAEGLGKERYPVRETGIGPLIERFGKLVEGVEHGANIGTVKYLGLVKREEFSSPVYGVLHNIPAGVDPTLPKGGQRLWYFDTTLSFPVLVVAADEKSQPVEYYCYDRFLFPVRVEDNDFNPGILGRR